MRKFCKSANLILFVILLVVSIIYVPSFSFTAFSRSVDGFLYQNAWHLSDKGLNTTNLFRDIKSLTTKDVKVDRSDVVVAIIDSGVDSANPFFEEDTFWTNDKEIAGNNIDDDNNGVVDDLHGANLSNYDNLGHSTSKLTGDFSDCMINASNDVRGNHWHGTHVAGIVHAVAPNVKIMPIRAGYKVDDSKGANFNAKNSIMSVIYAVDNGADIINMSFGTARNTFNNAIHSFSFAGKSYNMSMQDAINYANENGVMVVAAAGNNGNEQVFYPASCKNVVSVMASDINGELWTGSNYGNFSVVAPGKDILSTIGKGVDGSNSNHKNLELGYQFKNGTSMASPYVAGVAALLMSVTKTDKATDLIPYITNADFLSEVKTDKLANTNKLLDYKAVSTMLRVILKGSDIPNEEDVKVQYLDVFDNEKISLKPKYNYEGTLKWYMDGKIVSSNSTYNFIPTTSCVIELKADGFVMERYVFNVKSYNKYLGTIIGGVVGGLVGLILIFVVVYYAFKKKKQA